MRTRWLLAAAVAAGCGGGPQVKSTGDYRPHSLEGKRVLVVPLAVSGDLGDARTGVILSSDTRVQASRTACHELANARGKGQVVCADEASFNKNRALADVAVLFATDKPIPSEVLQMLRTASGADHVLLFRPERVSSSRDVSRETTTKQDLGVAILAGPLIGSLVGTHQERTTSSTMEIRYTLSACLVDLHVGKLLKVGVHSGGGSRTEGRDLGFAEPPPVEPILATIMHDLGEEMLAD